MDDMIAYIPILTTCLSVLFTIEIFKHYRLRQKTYLLWWTIGVLTFGLGTLAESINVLIGWNQINFKYWYIVGALLGGFPLAQGSVYLLMNRRFANITSFLYVTIITGAAVLVILSPLNIPDTFDGRLTGQILSWQWVRLFTPVINIYAFIFLVGGALYSAIKYYRLNDRKARFKGNIFIAIGGLLPGIGGTFTRMGYVEVLYVTELVGLFSIYLGYRIIRSDKNNSPVKYED
jgi:hypothetical protein